MLIALTSTGMSLPSSKGEVGILGEGSMLVVMGEKIHNLCLLV